MTLTVGSLFSGIGGLDLGLERAGMRVIWQSEIDPYACKVLKKHWPEVPNHGDIKKIKWEEVARPDVICGGYPCQPFSQAGKRRGEEDPRHLWPWVREAISELRPRYAILENVRGHLSMGGLSVIGELASIGYDAEWRVVSAASVGANHRRDRIVIVAYPSRKLGNGIKDHRGNSTRPEEVSELADGSRSQDVAYPDGCDSPDGRQREVRSREDPSWRDDGSGSGSDTREVGVGSARQTQRDVADANSEYWYGRGYQDCQDAFREWLALQESPSRGGFNVADADAWKTSWRLRSISENSGLVFGRENLRRGTEGYAGWQWWEVEPDVGRVVNGVPSRVDRLKGLGNAVVPQVAEVIGRLIMEASWSH